MRRVLKIIGVITAVLVIAWLGFLALVYSKMTGTPEQFGAFMAKMPMPAYFVLPFETLWSRARAGTVNVGDPAPDFELSIVDKSAKVRLSSYRGSKPVVLIFGSYT